MFDSGGLMWNQGAGDRLHPQKRKPHPRKTLDSAKTFKNIGFVPK